MNTSRHSLIFGLSYALDIAEKQHLSHSKNVAYLSVKMGQEFGLTREELLDVYYAALLHDIGVGNAYVMDEHCTLGEAMLKELPLSSAIPQYVLYHHEYYDGSGLFGLVGDHIPLAAQIICFASAFDDAFGNREDFDFKTHAEIRDWVQSVVERFSPDIITAFEKLIDQEFFLLSYFNRETKYILSKQVVMGDDTCYDYEDIKKFAGCFAAIIDRKSPFTFSHSSGIANLALKAAIALGYDEDLQHQMYIAGLLHDVGKLAVNPNILHKNGKLTPEERFEINKHTYFTRKILEQIDGFENIAHYAANHHERLNGKGYPYHLSGEELTEPDRVMAICDVYQALTEERPYRTQLPPEKVWKMIGDMVEQNHLDGNLAERLRNAF